MNNNISPKLQRKINSINNPRIKIYLERSFHHHYDMKIKTGKKVRTVSYKHWLLHEAQFIKDTKEYHKITRAIENRSSKYHHLYNNVINHGWHRNSKRGKVVTSLIKYGYFESNKNISGSEACQKLSNQGYPFLRYYPKNSNHIIYVLGDDKNFHYHKASRTSLVSHSAQLIWDRCPKNKKGRRYCPRCGKIFEPNLPKDTVNPPKINDMHTDKQKKRAFQVDHGVSVHWIRKMRLTDAQIGINNLFPICGKCNKDKVKYEKRNYKHNPKYRKLIHKSIKYAKKYHKMYPPLMKDSSVNPYNYKTTFGNPVKPRKVINHHNMKLLSMLYSNNPHKISQLITKLQIKEKRITKSRNYKQNTTPHIKEKRSQNKHIDKRLKNQIIKNVKDNQNIQK